MSTSGFNVNHYKNVREYFFDKKFKNYGNIKNAAGNSLPGKKGENHMKRITKFLGVPLLLALSIITTTFANSPSIIIGNQTLPVNAVTQNGRVLVPLRAIFEALDATVDYDAGTKTITGNQNGKIVTLQLNNKAASVDGKKVLLDVPATAIKGVTLVPVRFIGESLGAEVTWANNTVFIKSGQATAEPVAPVTPPTPTRATYKVVRVVDGDTIIINYNGAEERLRLIGIDTPESVHQTQSKNVVEGKIASDYTKSMLEGKEVGVEFDVELRDQYDRLLGYVYIDDKMLNKTLLEQGYAKITTFPPNVKYVDAFKALQKSARESKKGFWIDGFDF